MAIQWAEYREKIRRSILSDVVVVPEPGFEDEVSPPSWSDEQILDCAIWAMDTFAAHTALPKIVTFGPDSHTPYDLASDRAFALPDDVYEDVASCGLCYITHPDGNITYLDPTEYTPGLRPQRNLLGFYVWPDATLNIVTGNTVFRSDDVLNLQYFAYYPAPDEDTDEILVPRWAHMAVAYLSGAYALGPVGVQSATIDRWKDKTDSGNPEQNALRVQQKWFLQMYEQEISRYSRQDRVNAFREIR